MDKKQKILIVDDVASNIQLLSTMLKEKYTIIAAKDGTKAIQLAQKEPKPDIILLDIMLPDIDGYEVCKTLKSNSSTIDIPIIFVTSLNDIDEQTKGIEAGGSDYIIKPVSKQIVEHKVQTQLELSNLKQNHIEVNKKVIAMENQENNKQKILIIDDAPENIKMAVEILKDQFTVNVATSASKGLEIIENGNIPDIILLDVIMPDTDGFQMCKMLKDDKNLEHIPVIFLTILENEKDIVHGLELGAVDYVTKPFEPAVLKARVQTHLKLKDYQDQLLQSIKDKENVLIKQSKFAILGEMFENITHQWKQPLSIISMSSANIRVEKELDTLSEDALFELLDQIDNSTSHLAQTIDDFRDFLNHETIKEYFILKKTIEKTIKLLESKLKNRNISVDLDLDDSEIYSFKNDLIQVLMNILGNSVDILDRSNNQEKYIKINSKKDIDTISLTISDNGGGIDENILPNIFDKYFTTKKDQKGSGLGLYMSKKIVEENLNGKIKAYNTNSNMANFEIKIPLK